MPFQTRQRLQDAGKTGIWWSNSNIRYPLQQARLRMLELKDHQQILDSSGVQDLTFALRACG
jgi:hypothetical protein